MSLQGTYRFPWRDGHKIELLIDGNVFYPRMLGAIEQAQHFILLEAYLVKSGSIFNSFKTSLLRAADKGVSVFILFDDYGCLDLAAQDRKTLRHPNIQLIYYNPLFSHSTLLNLYRIFWHGNDIGLHRDHRKLLLVDKLLAFAGGAGISDEFGPIDNGQTRWRETMVQIQGPAVSDWYALFEESWNKYANSQLPSLIAPPADNKLYSHLKARVTVNEHHRRVGIQRSLLTQLHGAKHRIWFATAYFVPSWRIRRKLIRAARTGLDVRLLLPGPVTDHPGVRYASHHFYGKLLRNGVRIFEYQPRFLHAKTVLCDSWVSIGSCNFDRWNIQWNLEANQEIDDKGFANVVTKMFLQDFEHSLELDLTQWQKRKIKTRLLEWFWRQIERLSLKVKRKPGKQK